MGAPPKGKVAFITGANGISGNAIIEHLIRRPESEWSKIIITSRRAPTNVFWQDPRVQFIAIDFLKPVDELVDLLAPFCHDVTHAFFASYVHAAKFSDLKEPNVILFENFMGALDKVAANSLERIILQTGGKHYGAHLGPRECPLHEGLPRYEDYGENFYYPQEDLLFRLSEERNWDWNVIRPNAIIGFTPSGNGMSLALTLGIYLLCCREMGEVPMFPGNKFFFSCIDDCSYAPSIADMSVWAGTSEHCKNEAFNHTNGDVFQWKTFWNKISDYFGIDVPELTEWKALGNDQVMANNFLMTEWAKDKEEVWLRVVAKHGGNPDAFKWGTWDFFDWAVGKAWCTISSIAKARKYGWTRFDDTYTTYLETFQAFENAGVLPKSHGWRAARLAKKAGKSVDAPMKKVNGHVNGNTNGITNGAKVNGQVAV